MLRWMLTLCLAMTVAGWCRAGGYVDASDDELIFLPDAGGRPTGPVTPDGQPLRPPPAPRPAVPTQVVKRYPLEPPPSAPRRPEPPPALEPAKPSGPVYDRLPRFFNEMNQYDRIAMEPYRSTYDSMPMREKAELYSRQFEYMNNRKPNFSPKTLEEIAASSDVAASRRQIYKPPQKRKEREAADLRALPGPWAQNAPPAPAPDEEGEYYRNPDGTISVPRDRRMESLRGGWDVRQMRRQR